MFLDSLRQHVEPAVIMEGAALGSVLRGAVAFAYRAVRARVNLLIVFRLSTLLVLLLVVQLLVAELGELLRFKFQDGAKSLAVIAPPGG